MNFFVLILAGDLTNLLEATFFLMYHTGMQPSEVDKLSTYEFNQYIDYLKDYLKSDREREVNLAQYYGMGGLFREKNNISTQGN